MISEEKTHAICQLAASPLRLIPTDESEIVSQLLFGDYVTVVESGQPWVKVKNDADGYEGWMDFKQLKFISESAFRKGVEIKHQVVGNSQLQLKGPFGILTVFLGSTLPFFDKESNTCKISDDTYKLQDNLITASKENITELCNKYLNAPYLWGGKSLFGIDCSGLTQNIFKAIGKQVPRNASEQVHIGKNISWENRAVNDVIFYTTTSPKVTHVGILIEKNEIIHAHGRVRIDKCDQKGIFNGEQVKYTHVHHSIKRWC